MKNHYYILLPRRSLYHALAQTVARTRFLSCSSFLLCLLAFAPLSSVHSLSVTLPRALRSLCVRNHTRPRALSRFTRSAHSHSHTLICVLCSRSHAHKLTQLPLAQVRVRAARARAHAQAHVISAWVLACVSHTRAHTHTRTCTLWASLCA